MKSESGFSFAMASQPFWFLHDRIGLEDRVAIKLMQSNQLHGAGRESLWSDLKAKNSFDRQVSVPISHRWLEMRRFFEREVANSKIHCTLHCNTDPVKNWQLKSYYLNSSCLKECCIKSLNLQKFSRAWVLRWSQTGHFTPRSLGCLGGSSLPVMQAPLQSIIDFHRIRTNKHTFMWN